jgi:hypothetical protein
VLEFGDEDAAGDGGIGGEKAARLVYVRREEDGHAAVAVGEAAAGVDLATSNIC